MLVGKTWDVFLAKTGTFFQVCFQSAVSAVRLLTSEKWVGFLAHSVVIFLCVLTSKEHAIYFSQAKILIMSRLILR